MFPTPEMFAIFAIFEPFIQMLGTVIRGKSHSEALARGISSFVAVVRREQIPRRGLGMRRSLSLVIQDALPNSVCMEAMV